MTTHPSRAGLRIKIVQRAALILTIVIVATNSILVALGIIEPKTAISLFLAAELPIAAIAIAISFARYRSIRKAGSSPVAAFEAVAGSFVTKAIRTEIYTYKTLLLWLRNKKSGVAPGVQPFGYAKGTFGIPIAFGIVTFIEIIAVHLLVPWQWLRIALLIGSLYGILLLLSFASSRVVHPHLLTRHELRLREGPHLVATIPIENITAVRVSKRFSRTTPGEVSGRMYLPSQDGTNIDIELDRELTVTTPGLLKKQRRVVRVGAISLHIDNPDELASSIRSLQVASSEFRSHENP
ncbi:hypothetical protein ACL02S_02130 [Nocardia sp. 004]|uniref:hypothetical protein n=1 Tax=Nocardia sp. 004 TaxID=3385978 RepID=UPI00399FBDDC